MDMTDESIRENADTAAACDNTDAAPDFAQSAEGTPETELPQQQEGEAENETAREAVDEVLNAEDEGGETAEDADEKSGKKKNKKHQKTNETVTVKKKEWDEITANCAEYLDTAKRIQAEFVNYKKRNENIRIESYNEGIAYALIGMLPVLDNLERMIAQMRDADEKHRQGIELILRQMRDALEKLGVEEIEAAGKKFDPKLYQAVSQTEPGEGQESGYVAEVLMKGYQISGRVLRYAMVSVFS